MIRTVGHATKRNYWRWSPCGRLQRRLESWQRELRTNSNGFAYAAPQAIQAIKEQMRVYGCRDPLDHRGGE